MVNMSEESFEDSDYICSYGMKLTWDINDPKLPQVWDKMESLEEVNGPTIILGRPKILRAFPHKRPNPILAACWWCFSCAGADSHKAVSASYKRSAQEHANQHAIRKTCAVACYEAHQEPKHFDSFQEWSDGYLQFIYSSEDKNAQRHLSGWAMRNTNNHNCQILKKSCLGVVVCARNCTLPDGTKLQLRPAICDKARQKQQKKHCPNCSSTLELIPCRGHSGYPVTNFWRHEGKAIFFQAKGIHDHPRPESKSETEARRSALKKQTPSSHLSHKKGLLDIQTGTCNENGSHFHYIHHVVCEGAEKFSIITDASLPPQAEPHHFQNADPYKVTYDAASFQDVVLPLQKFSAPQVFTAKPTCDYECAFPSCVSSNSYPTHHKDLIDMPADTDYVTLNGLQYCVSSLNAHERIFDGTLKHQGLQLPLGETNYGESIEYELSPTNVNHPHYNEEYACRFSSHSSLEVPALQTVITTTTKMSYEAYKSAAVKYGDNFYSAKDLNLGHALAENISGNIYSEIKAQEEWATVKSSLLGEQFLTTDKAEHVELVVSEEGYTGCEDQAF